MAALRVAVCTNRRADLLEPCLRALAEQVPGGDVVVVLNAVGDDAAAVSSAAVAELVPGALVVREDEPGLGVARERALAEMSDQDFIAFVDDDAVIGPAWYESLRRAWDEAGPDIACIGGPIRPRFLATPPEWITPWMLSVLSVFDQGSEPGEITPPTLFYGANFSFRCGVVRASGGFDLRQRGLPAALRFGDDDEPQVAVVSRGYRLWYVPDAWVWHLIPPERMTARAIAGRRFHHGVSLRARRLRPRGLALALGLKAAVGSGVSFVLRDRSRAIERAGFAAENAGVLLAPLVLRRQGTQAERLDR